MEIKLKKYPINIDNLLSIETAFNYYYSAYKDLENAINDKYNNYKLWKVIKRRYNINLFNDMENAIDTCEKLDIKNIKRLKTSYLKCILENNKKEYYFEDWLVIYNKKFNSKKIYNEDEIIRMELLDEIEVLCDKGIRKINQSRLDIDNEDSLITTVYVDGKYKGCEIGDFTQTRNEDYLSTFRYCEKFNIDKHPEIKEKIIDSIFNYERLLNDKNTLRFKALELLKLARNLANEHNIDINKQLEDNRIKLI